MLSHILFGVIGFLLGSAGAGGAVYGAKKRSPLSFLCGLLFLCSGVAVLCNVLTRVADDDDEPDDEPGDDADEVEIKIEVEKSKEDADDDEAEASDDEADAAKAEASDDEAEASDDAPADKKESDA